MEEDTGEDVGEQIAPMRQHKKKDIRVRWCIVFSVKICNAKYY